MNMSESAILQNAIEALKMNTDFQLEVAVHEVNFGKSIDAILLSVDHKERFAVNCKAWAAHKNTSLIIQQIHKALETDPNTINDETKLLPMFAADYINPRMGEDLRLEGINYIDMAGNAYIKTANVHIHIEGKKKQFDRTLATPGRAFTTTGLKVVFALLSNERLLNAPYREIAKQADVALGTIGWGFKDLTDQGFINKNIKTKNRQWVDKEELTTRWVQEFPKLQVKTKLGDFYTNNRNLWQQLKDTKHPVSNTKLGSEYAAAILTNNYKPKEGTLYLQQEQMNDCLKKYRLIKTTQPLNDALFKVSLYEKFWGDTLDTQGKESIVVEPLLAYAELLTTGEPRNREIANDIYKQYLQAQ